MNSKERTQPLRLLEYFEEYFDGTLGNWYTDTFNLDINPGSKTFNSKYYLVPILNKETFSKDLKRLAKIGLSAPVHQSQYRILVFIIPKKEGTARFITDYCRLNHQLVRNPYP